MTWDEFDGTWFPEHSAYFTGIRAWLDRTTKGSDAPTHDQIIRGWYGVLRDVDLEAAKAASQRMHAGEIEEPKGFDRHPAAIRRACGVSRRSSLIGPRYDADGNQTYACPNCRDEGWELCWSPTSMRAARDGTLGKVGTIYSEAVVCHCPAGNTHARGKDWPRFDPKKRLPILMGTWHEGDRERLTEFMSKMRPANYEPAFG